MLLKCSPKNNDYLGLVRWNEKLIGAAAKSGGIGQVLRGNGARAGFIISQEASNPG
jgi:hypothetical protein